jgi:hypothetical protein
VARSKAVGLISAFASQKKIYIIAEKKFAQKIRTPATSPKVV